MRNLSNKYDYFTEYLADLYGYNGDSVWIWGIEVTGIPDSAIEVFDNQFLVTFPTFSTQFDDNVLGLYSITYVPQYFVVCPAHYMKQVPIENVVSNIIGCADLAKTDENFLNGSYSWYYIKMNDLYLNLSQENFPLDLNIYNSLGVKVYSETVENPEKIVNINNLCRGLYFVSIKNRSRLQMSRKFIIQ